jgi:classical protein kinase C
VTYKLRELAYKLDIEKKVKIASEKLERLGVDAADGNAESGERVVLLKRALQKYQGLYIPGQGMFIDWRRLKSYCLRIFMFIC